MDGGVEKRLNGDWNCTASTCLATDSVRQMIIGFSDISDPEGSPSRADLFFRRIPLGLGVGESLKSPKASSYLGHYPGLDCTRQGRLMASLLIRAH